MASVGGIVERQGRSRSADILGLDSKGRLVGVELKR
jgi:RecB family endonuclease NucS